MSLRRNKLKLKFLDNKIEYKWLKFFTKSSAELIRENIDDSISCILIMICRYL